MLRLNLSIFTSAYRNHNLSGVSCNCNFADRLNNLPYHDSRRIKVAQCVSSACIVITIMPAVTPSIQRVLVLKIPLITTA